MILRARLEFRISELLVNLYVNMVAGIGRTVPVHLTIHSPRPTILIFLVLDLSHTESSLYTWVITSADMFKLCLPPATCCK